MQSVISKMCADSLRADTLNATNERLKATHARELTAAFFGYKSHAALLAESEFTLSRISDADILVPDIALMDKRRECLVGLPPNLPNSIDLAEGLVDVLVREQLFSGSIWWARDGFETYILEELLPENDYIVMDDLSGQMAETNALFDETIYEEVTIDEENGNLKIAVSGKCNGTSDQDRPFSGDQIDMTVLIEMERVAGKNAYSKPFIKASGNVNWDWAEMDEFD